RNSLSLLQTVFSSHPLVQKIQDWLFRLSTRKKAVHFCWVPSHVGVPRNEQVDSLAHSAITTGRITKCAVPASDYFPVYKHLLFQ
ncbi:RNase H family protein, partial [Escherichia coli]|uniref:RNase H family protein n=1 Tax=Escherichia coli TaxID=562 RepID=UPI003C6D0071